MWCVSKNANFWCRFTRMLRRNRNATGTSVWCYIRQIETNSEEMANWLEEHEKQSELFR